MDGYAVLSYAHRVGKPAVLATLVHAQGHSYRKPGATMLLLPDGGKIGCLSSGCLEADLQLRSEQLLISDEAEIVTYNLQPEEDAIWGEAIGCGGMLRILLEPLGSDCMSMLADAYRIVESGREVEWLRYSSARRKLEYELVPRLFDGIPLAQDRGQTKQTKQTKQGSESLFSTVFRPRARLFVFGADEGTLPIARLAGQVGFRIAIGDWRASVANSERYPDAEIAVGSREEIMDSLRLGSEDYVLICGHQLRKDREMLECVLPIRPAFLGIMGSKSRIGHLLEGLTKSEFTLVSAPVGLDIGAEGPEEIAVSIVAQLIATRKERMKDRRVSTIASRGNVLGCWSEQEDVHTEATHGTCSR
ncbi:XdhC/CoxI family protein [Cohnella endophytica]|uniref:XdhC/CoxI family protein n=1 Tax=Cohnella endophytica TaxID=2419778 RepID=A0A494Y1Z2_9BACL|nr:XdhC/CoxI family protein [Cohnella endophytica]RKP55423.1 XdhC/CoxI family protein [Cohnella endophytica]